MTDMNYLLARIRELVRIELEVGDLNIGAVDELCKNFKELDEHAKQGNFPRDWLPF